MSGVSSVSGNKAQFVFEIYADEYALDPRVDIYRRTQALLPGTMVRLYIGNARAIPFAIPMVSPFDFDWYRRDLTWQVVGSNETRLLEWHQVITELEAVK